MLILYVKSASTFLRPYKFCSRLPKGTTPADNNATRETSSIFKLNGLYCDAIPDVRVGDNEQAFLDKYMIWINILFNNSICQAVNLVLTPLKIIISWYEKLAWVNTTAYNSKGDLARELNNLFAREYI